MANTPSSNSKVTQILDGYETYLQKRKEEAEKIKSEQETFREQFAGVRDKVIKPVLERYKSIFEVRGHRGEIEAKEATWNIEKEYFTEPSITIELTLKPKDENSVRSYNYGESPHLAFWCDSSKKEIWTHVSTIGSGHGGHAGSEDRVSIEKVTESFVEKAVVKWLEDLMKDATPNY